MADATNNDHKSGEKSHDDLTTLLDNLALKDSSGGVKIDKKLAKLQKEIDRIGFRIFECITDKGYFAWTPLPPAQRAGTSYVSLSNVNNSDQLMISKYLDLDGKPDTLVSSSSIRTPKIFLSSFGPHEHKNEFPHGKLDIICLHVATKYRGIDFDKDDINFVFGGSTLEMLARCDDSDPYMVIRIPGTSKTILVSKNKDYVKNLSDVGFQFERLMTGRAMDAASSDWSTVEHLHVMNVGTFRVLFHAETDAVVTEETDSSDNDNDVPVEIKASNPRYWGTKVMFQMISNGSTKLCHGIKSRGSLQAVKIQSLYQVAQTALLTTNTATLERNIITNMKSIESQMKNATPGDDVFKISFHGTTLSLLPMRGRSSTGILPPPSIVRELLAGK